MDVDLIDLLTEDEDDSSLMTEDDSETSLIYLTDDEDDKRPPLNLKRKLSASNFSGEYFFL